MPITTPIYRLVAFQTQEGEYSSSLDKARMTTIASHLDFASKFIGDGKISGWDLADDSSSGRLKIKLTSGYGFIGSLATYSYGDISVPVPDNATSYVYVQQRKGIIGGFSGFSDIVTVEYSDILPPMPPTDFIVDQVGYNFVSLKWAESSDVDFSHFVLERSEDNSSWSVLANITDNFYLDSSVSENTPYYYRLKSLDQNDNESLYSTLTPSFVKTLADLRPPARPSKLVYSALSSSFQLVWSSPVVGDVKNYEVRCQPLDVEYKASGVELVYSLPSTANDYLIPSLLNGSVYRVRIYSVSKNGVYSAPTEFVDSPRANIGPPEVSSVKLTSSASSSNQNAVALNVSWTPNFDPYSPLPYKYLITLIKDAEVVSKPIQVFNSNTITIEAFSTDDAVFPIDSRTEYFVKVQSQDKKGNNNAGIISKVYSSNFLRPSAPYNLSIGFNPDKALLFSWSNSKSIFQSNMATIVKKNLTTGVVTSILSSRDLGVQSTYVIEPEDVEKNTEYSLSVKCIDELGLQSDVSSKVFVTDKASSLIPNEINDIISTSSDGSITLRWSGNSKFKSYTIWRGPVDASDPSDFSVIATIPSPVTTFTDYDVVNGEGYSYFITITTVDDVSSPNPINDNYANYVFRRVSPSADASFSKPFNTNIVSAIDNTATISWESSEDSLDGFEIYKSYGDKNSWKKVGSVGRSVRTFTEENGLVKAGEYHYMVRAYRNEVDVVLTPVKIGPADSLYVGKVVCAFGTLSAFTGGIRTAGFETVVKEITQKLLKKHRHSLTDDEDNRIDLAEDLIVSRWKIKDKRIYVTTQDISGASHYVVKIDGEPSKIFYEVNPEKKRVVFATPPLAGQKVVLKCVGVNQIQGTLSSRNILKVSPWQIGTGKFPAERFGPISHVGRVNSELCPLKFRLMSRNGFSHTIAQNAFSTVKESVGSSETFYDILESGHDSGLVLMASNKGVYLSRNAGVQFPEFYPTSKPVHKLFYSELRKGYFFASINEVYFSEDGEEWVRTQGLENTSFVRSITEDSTHVYVSTDLGVFSLNSDQLGELLIFESASPVTARSSDCYALWRDKYSDRIVVSNQFGLFETFDKGKTWKFSVEMEEPDPIFQIITKGTYVFALKDDSIWRKLPGDSVFTRIAYLPSGRCRKMAVYKESIIVTTNDGFFYSSPDIYDANNISLFFISRLTNNGLPFDATLLKATSSRLYMGTDHMVFWTDETPEELNLFYYNHPTKIPTIYIGDQKASVGAYYNSSTVYFDQPVAEAFVVNQYNLYRAKDGGWADQNYEAVVSFMKNGEEVANFSDLSPPISALKDVVFPSFNEKNSNSKRAKRFVTQYNSELDRLQGIFKEELLLEEGESLSDVVTNVINLFYKVNSQILGDNVFVSTVEINSISYYVVGNEMFVSDAASSLLKGKNILKFIPSDNRKITDIVQFGTVDGLIGFHNEFNKYDEMTMTLKGSSVTDVGENTHGEIENILSLNSSGFYPQFAKLHQSHYLQSEISLKKIFGSYKKDKCHGRIGMNSNIILPGDNGWYDKINSSIGYDLVKGSVKVGFSPSYISCVKWASNLNVILVGSDSGLFSINASDAKMLLVDFGIQSFVWDIKIHDNVVYIYTENGIFYSYDLKKWNKISTDSLDGKPVNFFIINNTYIALTDRGAYYYNYLTEKWTNSLPFYGATFGFQSDMIFVVINNSVHYSGNGIDWTFGGSFNEVEVLGMAKFRANVVMASKAGLRSDNATLYSPNVQSSLIDIKGNLSDSSALNINCVDTNADNTKILCGDNKGVYYVYDGVIWKTYIESDLSSIHKCLFVGKRVWLFGFNMVKPPFYENSFRITTGERF